MAARTDDIDALIDRYAGDYEPRTYSTNGQWEASALPPRLGPELVEHATSVQERALALHREAELLEAEAEQCFDAIKALQA